MYLDFGGSWQEEGGFIEKTKVCQEKLEEKQEGWIFFNLIYFLYDTFLLVIYFIHISVYMSIPISQFITPPPPRSPLGAYMFVLHACVSISALQTGSSVPFF